MEKEKKTNKTLDKLTEEEELLQVDLWISRNLSKKKVVSDK